MKACVNKDTCIGCGLCVSICPKVFKMDNNDLAEAIDGELDESVMEEVEEAQNQCPIEAINIEK
jgi:ferredoxin